MITYNQHAEELSSTRNEIQFNKQEVKELYLSLIDEPDSSVDELSHSQLVAESKRITESLKEQVCAMTIITCVPIVIIYPCTF